MNIYLDNAATTKMSRSAIEAMMPYFDNVYGNPSGLHSHGQRAAEALADARARVAAVIGAQPREIYFTSGGSEADTQAIISAARFGAMRGKRHIISTQVEHHAVLHTLEALEKEGFHVSLLPVDEHGLVSAEQVRMAIRPDTALVSVMFANNEVGTVMPIAEIGAVCHEQGVLFHTDAVQAAGHLPIHVKDMNIDLLSMSAHKFHGPKGVGVLYARVGVLLQNVIYGGAQERGTRAGTENVAGIMGMAAALEEAVANMDGHAAYMEKLRNRLMEGLSEIPHSLLNGHPEKRLPNNVSFCFEGIEGESLLLLLDDKGIAASSGSACTSGDLDPSHVLLAMDRPHEIAHGSLRLTLSHENTMEEVEYTIEAVKEVVAYLRSISPVWRDLINGKSEFIIKEA